LFYVFAVGIVEDIEDDVCPVDIPIHADNERLSSPEIVDPDSDRLSRLDVVDCDSDRLSVPDVVDSSFDDSDLEEDQFVLQSGESLNLKVQGNLWSVFGGVREGGRRGDARKGKL